MRIVVIGATGIIGRAVVDALGTNHEILRVGLRRGDYTVDLASKPSIAALFETVGTVDAVVSTAGDARFGRLADLTDEDFALALHNKLLGQVNLVRVGVAHVTDGGSFTLTSGILAQTPMPGSAAISLANAGLEGFARAAALELPRGIRINVVSPVFVKETMEAIGMDSTAGMPASVVARAYVASVEGTQTGTVLDVRDHA